MEESHGGSFKVYFDHKIEKQRNKNVELQEKHYQSDIFKGVVIFVNGYTNPPREQLKHYILQYGGQFEAYLTSKVTHMIVSNLSFSKINEIHQMHRQLHIVHSSWIIQSIEKGMKLPMDKYLFKPAYKNQSIRGCLVPIETEEASEQEQVTEQQENQVETVDSDHAIIEQRKEKEVEETKTCRGPTSTRDGPGFVESFFGRSRLHHIGVWRTELGKRKFSSVTSSSLNNTQGEKWIFHVDMDCFFVSVAIRDQPELTNTPLAVAHSSSLGTSEISSCNYAAREKGVSAGMFMKKAKALCPELKVLPYNFQLIQSISEQIYEVFHTYSTIVQGVSCDECFLEISVTSSAMEVAQQLRTEIFQKTKCTASIGIGKNMLLARLATKRAKPNGQFQITEAEDFLTTIQVSDLPGVGYSLGLKLRERQIQTCADLRRYSKLVLCDWFGQKKGEKLYKYARGIDERNLTVEYQRKSVSVDINWGIRFQSGKEVERFMSELVKELCSRLQAHQVKTSQLTIKVLKRRKDAPEEPEKYMGCGACDTLNRSQNIWTPTDDASQLTRIAIQLIKQLNIAPDWIRGTGLTASKLVESCQTEKGSERRNLEMWLQQNKHERDEQSRKEQSVPPQAEEPASRADMLSYFPSKKPRKQSTTLTQHFAPSEVIFNKTPTEAEDLTGKIDEEVFWQLPLTIRKEIIQTLKQKKQPKKIETFYELDQRIRPTTSSSPSTVKDQCIDTQRQNLMRLMERIERQIKRLGSSPESGWIQTMVLQLEAQIGVVKHRLDLMAYMLRVLTRLLSSSSCKEILTYSLQSITEDIKNEMQRKVQALETPWT